MAAIYCGNNASHSDLISGLKSLGTRYTCMRNGIGIGLNKPYDHSYTLPYNPIDTTKIYCGNNTTLPHGYDRFGNLPQCLQKGVGVGKLKRASRGPAGLIGGTKQKSTSYTPIIIFTISAFFIFILLYLGKPICVMKINNNGKYKIDSLKLIKIYILLLLLLATILFTITCLLTH